MIPERPPPVHVLLLANGTHRTRLPLARLLAAGCLIDDRRSDTDGVATARTLRPDVVLMDLPEGSRGALDLCRELQADAVTRSIPIIAITGNPAIGQFMMALGVKPCTDVSLHAEVLRLLAN